MDHVTTVKDPLDSFSLTKKREVTTSFRKDDEVCPNPVPTVRLLRDLTSGWVGPRPQGKCLGSTTNVCKVLSLE